MSFQQLDNPFDGGGLTPPPGYVVPSFPSLYDPRFDFGDNDPNNPPPGTYYLYNSFGELAPLCRIERNYPNSL
ncbi:hypothetical protein RHS03_05370, partial [Rhizoctonia solani]